MTREAGSTGSRFLYDSFGAASARIEANERITEMQFGLLEGQLARIEGLIERLERRLWVTVYGVAAVILAQATVTLLGLVPGSGG
ncbi:hypothetical protein [Pseudoruegeria sp. SHC-113]|uniref:GTA head formation protein, RCAP_rcc01685 family n=1 Tax=Pseudoruegeria sp. SHC-113 TaxID=2855439 RepID=UPI0021BA58CB|nr:hypothetical protein [Pseudoruegeria sp. SHC-113]MCT8160116.1 hypothetical protein [Pseudoruegeria sp. SHC-113]